jgi:hypothetical protein
VDEPERLGFVEPDVHHDPLGRGDESRFDELLVLVVTAVGADELHPGAGNHDVEDSVFAVFVR